MRKMKLGHLVLINFLVLYALIGFITWDWNWIENLSTTTNWNRFLFLIGVIIKIVIDVLLFNYFFENSKDKQKELNKEAESYQDKRGLDEYNNSKKR